MFTIQYGGKGGKKYNLQESDSLIAVRTHTREAVVGRTGEVAALSQESRDLLREFDPVASFSNAGVQVLQVRATRGARAIRDDARTVLKAEPAIRFAGRVLVDSKSKAPVLYTENCFVKFTDDIKAGEIKKLLKQYGFILKRALGYAHNAYFIAAHEGIGLDLFDLVNKLLQENAIELAHPEMVRRIGYKAANPNQWHLKKTSIGGVSVDAHANVEAAWALADGTGITIAVIDDGVDLDHEEFRGGNKILAPRDVTLSTDNPRPGSSNRHGTACAGVACANGSIGASGVAPKARLIPIRLVSGLGSQAEADAFVHAAQNGADVISCSWGPEDGDWSNPDDPLHNQVVPIPDSTRLAIDFAVNQGRNGKGCVVCFAAGNGNESVDNDGYASYPKVIAVAAINDLGKRSAYSDIGNAIWCAFPSNEVIQPRLTSGIWTTDNSGPSGYNPGQTVKGDAAGNYTNSFGGTSSASPGAAGVAALILARNPNLRWDEVRDIMKRCCDKVDAAGGNYDAAGHSAQYGYGRLNARNAVELAVALPTPTNRVISATARKDVAIPDLRTAKLGLNIAETALLKDIKVTVDIEHTYIGDLQVSIQPPTSTGVSAIMLHDKQGGGTDNLRVTYDKTRIARLAELVGKNPQGNWNLVVKDTERLDVGRIRSVTLEMTL